MVAHAETRSLYQMMGHRPEQILRRVSVRTPIYYLSCSARNQAGGGQAEGRTSSIVN